jgi:hypothetical protein
MHFLKTNVCTLSAAAAADYFNTYNTKSLSGEGAEAASPISVLSLTPLWANTKALVLHITLAAVAAGQINIEFTHL